MPRGVFGGLYVIGGMNMKLNLIENQSEVFKDELNDLITSSTEIKMAVAFIKKTGIDLIKKSLEHSIKNNDCKIKILGGESFGLTQSSALEELLKLKNKYQDNIELKMNPKQKNTFHPKLYIFSNKKGHNAIIGSSNLSEKALSNNMNTEVNVRLSKNKKSKTLTNADKYFDQLWNDELNRIVDKNYIVIYKKEVETKWKPVRDKETKLRTKLQKYRGQKIHLLLKSTTDNVRNGYEKVVDYTQFCRAFIGEYVWWGLDSKMNKDMVSLMINNKVYFYISKNAGAGSDDIHFEGDIIEIRSSPKQKDCPDKTYKNWANQHEYANKKYKTWIKIKNIKSAKMNENNFHYFKSGKPITSTIRKSTQPFYYIV